MMRRREAGVLGEVSRIQVGFDGESVQHVQVEASSLTEIEEQDEIGADEAEKHKFFFENF